MTPQVMHNTVRPAELLNNFGVAMSMTITEQQQRLAAQDNAEMQQYKEVGAYVALFSHAYF